jgi:hypothetical protein
VDPRADLDVIEKRQFLILPGLELRPLSRPAVATDCALPATSVNNKYIYKSLGYGLGCCGSDYFCFVIPFYLQSVLVHSANCVKRTSVCAEYGYPKGTPNTNS